MQNPTFSKAKHSDTSASLLPPTSWTPYSVVEDDPAIIEVETDDESREIYDHPDLILFSSLSESEDTISERTHGTTCQDDPLETSILGHFNNQVDNDEHDNYNVGDGQNDAEDLTDHNVPQQSTPDEAVRLQDATLPELHEPDDAPPGYEAPEEEVGTRKAVIYDDGLGVERRETLIQDGVPKKHNRISFYNPSIGRWSFITITSNPSKRKGWKHFYNYINSDGETGGIYLRPDERWTFVDEEKIELEHNEVPDIIAQVDGEFMPVSLTPTPETSPDQELARLTGTRPKQNLRFGVADFWNDSSASDSTDPATAVHDPSRDSPEWDPYGTDLHSPDLLDVAVDHGHPILHQPSPNSTEEIFLNKVANLDHVLPLTSTPNPSPPRRKRISNLRRSLPLESPRSHRPVFLKRLNPFKKKTQKEQ